MGLHDAGYTTFYAGKFLNGYGNLRADDRFLWQQQ
jgi:hypothetical protein